jgi:hypothetical protein
MTNTQTIHLSVVGNYPAIPASELQVGMTRVYNFGITAPITKVDRTATWVLVTTVEKGTEYIQ